MVGTIKVLSGTCSGISRYFDLLDDQPRARYYATDFTGAWHGLAAGALGLTGPVEQSDFEAILAGYTPAGLPLVPRRTRTKSKRHAKAKQHPDTTKKPKRSKGKRQDQPEPSQKERERNLGLDVTFSVPKSVSLLWALGPLWVRLAIEKAIDKASKKTINNLEAMVPLARREKAGVRAIAAKLVVATFMHTLNRDNEPQLHVHNVIANLCLGADGRWAAVNSRLLHQWTPALGRIFRCHLARELKQSLGVELVRPILNGVQASWFEIKGVSRKLIEKFSSRRAAIEKTLSPSQLKDSAQRQRAAIETRREKAKDPDLDDLRRSWKETAGDFGLSEAKAESLCNRTVEAQPPPDFEKVFAASVKSLGRQKAHFHEADVVSAVCEDFQHHGVDPERLVTRVRDFIANSPDVVVLTESPANTRLTSRENWNIEKKLLRDANALSQSSGALVSNRIIQKTLKRHKHLDEEQRKAVEHLVSTPSGIRVLTGVAGAGKSTALDAVRDAFERSGFDVQGTSIAGKAACELNDKTGIESRTVASYLHHLEKTPASRAMERLKHDVRMLTRALRKKRTWKHEPVDIAKKSVLIIDEAGMLDTRTLSRLLHHCHKNHATVILTGDTSQLPPILAGGPMDHLTKKTGAANLSENRRQRNDQDRSAVQNVRDGKVEEALQDYARRDCLTVASDAQDAIEKLTESWCKSGGHRRPADHLILTQKRSEASIINRLCQSERLKRGRLVPGLTIKHGESRFYIGDRVAFHQPMRKHGIENGHGGTVLGVDPVTRKIVVRLDHEPNQRQKAMGIRRTQKISLLGVSGEAVQLGYASTTHRAQGITCDNTYVLLSGDMMSRELTYTQLTRARDKTRLFVDEATAGDELKSLIATMSRSASKDLAHDRVRQTQGSEPSADDRRRGDRALDHEQRIDRSSQ